MPSHYNGQSAESPVQPVTRSKVASAKRLMAAGFTMQQAAVRLDVLAADLDRELYRWLGFTADDMTAPVRRAAA